MTLTSTDDQIVVGSSNGDLSMVCCVTGDLVKEVRQAHDAAVNSVVVNSANTVLASGTDYFISCPLNPLLCQAAANAYEGAV